MRWSLSRLRPLHIALLSASYWLGLAAVKLGSAILAAWQISRLPPNHGSISASLQSTMLQLTIAQDGAVMWSGGTSLGALIMWVAGPPLLLALTWRLTREIESAGGAGPEAVDGGPAERSAMPLPPPRMPWPTGRGHESETTRVVEPGRPGAADPRTPPGGRAR